MSVIKAHLAQAIHEKTSLPKHRCAHLLESLLEIIKDRLEKEEEVLIRGFGRFYVKDNHGRKGGHSIAGEDLMLEAMRIVTFRPSPVLKDKMNAGLYGVHLDPNPHASLKRALPKRNEPALEKEGFITHLLPPSRD
jgi:integration host factor subunit alpha